MLTLNVLEHRAALLQRHSRVLNPYCSASDERSLIPACVRPLRKQEDLVQNVRRRLEEALTADMLAHMEDTAADAAASKEEEKVQQVDKEEL